MLLQDIKTKLGIPTFNLNTALDKEMKPTDWLRHWDNDNRVAVSIHKDTFNELKANPNIPDLGLQTEQLEGEKGPYMAYRIVKYKPAEFTL